VTGTGGAAAAPLIVLHGANGSAQEMEPLLERLRGRGRQVIAFDMLGHGGRPIPSQIKLADIAEDVIAHCDAGAIPPAHWFGFSVGGLVPLWLAAHHPRRVISVATLTTKFVYDAVAVAHATHLTDGSRVKRADPARAERLRLIHFPQDWERLIHVLQGMFSGFANAPPLALEELKRISQPVLTLGGLEDPLVPAEEVRTLAKLVARGATALFGGSAHPLTSAPLDAIARNLLAFLDNPEKFGGSSRVSLHNFRWDRT
jgi:3-oxoadipate enol-lactonase